MWQRSKETQLRLAHSGLHHLHYVRPLHLKESQLSALHLVCWPLLQNSSFLIGYPYMLSCEIFDKQSEQISRTTKTITCRFFRADKTSGPAGQILFLKQVSLKCAEHNAACWLTGSLKSTRCLPTNFIR